MTRALSSFLLLIGLPASIAGCGLILGLDEFVDAPAGAGAGGGAGSGSACEPGETRDCYSGPEGTQGVGLCRAGHQQCTDETATFGACEGEVLPATEECTVRGDEDCDGNPCSDALWAKLYGDAEYQEPYAVATDKDGNIYVAGSFAGYIHFTGVPLTAGDAGNAFLVKFAPSGKPIWSRRFGESGSHVARTLAVDPEGNVIVAGSFTGSMNLGGGSLFSAGQSDLWIAKFNPEGAHVWSGRFGDASSQAEIRVAVDPAGDITLAGRFEGTINFGTGDLVNSSGIGTDVFVAKLHGDGVALWSKRFGDSNTEYLNALAVDPEGSVYIGGQLHGTVSFGGPPLSGSPAIYLAKLDAFGAHLWSKTFGVTGFMAAIWGLAVDPGGDVIASGTFNNSLDFGTFQISQPASFEDMFVFKLSSTGEYRWAKVFGSHATDGARMVRVGPAGEILFACWINDSIAFGGPVLETSGSTQGLAKLSPEGDHLWSKIVGVGAPNAFMLKDMAVDPSSGDVVLVGSQQAEADYGLGPLTPAGGFDILVAKLAR